MKWINLLSSTGSINSFTIFLYLVADFAVFITITLLAKFRKIFTLTVVYFWFESQENPDQFYFGKQKPKNERWTANSWKREKLVEEKNGVDAIDSTLILSAIPFKHSRVYPRCAIILYDKILLPNVTYMNNIESNCVRHSLSGTCS